MPAAGISKIRKSADECSRIDELFAQLNNSKKNYGKDSADDKRKPEDRRETARTNR